MTTLWWDAAQDSELESFTLKTRYIDSGSCLMQRCTMTDVGNVTAFVVTGTTSPDALTANGCV